MKTLSHTFFKMPVAVMFFVAVPLFYFLFLLAYKPFDMEVFLAVGQGRFTLNLIVSTLIVLGVMVLSRLLLYLLRGVMDLNWSLYVLWCFGEGILCGLFLSIPMGIGWADRPYFTVMSLCILYMAGILVFPLSILSMAVQLHVLGDKAKMAPAVDEKTLIRFYDETKRLKLVVSSEAVLYIEAQKNIVVVSYMKDGEPTTAEVHTTLTAAIEDLKDYENIFQCHRSFVVNAATL